MTDIILIYILIINIVGFVLMAVDKKRAAHQEWRIKEATLFRVALVGGSLGAWLGMYTFRHKTKHKQFVIGIPAILLVQLLVIIWITSVVH